VIERCPHLLEPPYIRAPLDRAASPAVVILKNG
jgi:hypothetical protein